MAGKFGKFTDASVKAGTDTGTGKGNPKLHASSGIVDEAIGNGQTIKRAFPLDTSDMELRNEHGEQGFRGGPTNVEHSLKGASVVDKNEPTGGKRSGWKWPDH
jgi:hypothetical protein